VRIVIDARMIGWTGIGRYTSHLLDELAALDHRHDFVALVGERPTGSAEPPTSMTTHRTGIRPYSLEEQLRLSGEVAALGPDLVHFPHLTVPFRYRSRFVVTVHDLTMLHFKNVGGHGPFKRVASEAKYASLRPLVRSTVRRASWVLAPSEHTAGEIWRELGADRQRITVTYEAADLVAAPPSAQPSPPDAMAESYRPYLLYVGNFYPHKNVVALLGAMELIARERSDVRLVLVGAEDYFQRRLREKAVRSGLGDRVLFAGRVDDATLASLYSRAELFVFPSMSEGFGLCGLEAMANGLAVAASRRTSLPEIYGGAADYFEPEDPADLANVVLNLLNDPSRRSALVRAGADRVRSYSWRRMAELTLECYERAVSGIP